MAQYRKENKLARMRIAERAIAGARNPAYLAKRELRRALKIILARR
jgi:hypothetical protein